MAEKALTDQQATALAGTTDPVSGLVYPASGASPWLPPRNRSDDRLNAVSVYTNILRVYEVEGNADAVGVRPGRVTLGGVVYDYAGLEPAVDGMADNDTTYIWAQDNGSGALEVVSAIDGTGWPPTIPHIKIAEVTMASGAITGILDRRSEHLMEVPAQILPFIETQGSTATFTRVHIQGPYGTHYLRVRICDQGQYFNASNAIVSAGGGSSVVENIEPAKDVVVQGNASGLFEIDVANAVAETMTLRTGPASFGSFPGDHSPTLDITHA